MDPSGAVVLVADGASAIGAATAAAFGAAGARVAVGRTPREPAAAGLGDFLIVGGDGAPAERYAEMVRRTVEHFGTVDVLIVGAVADRAVRSDQLRAEDVHAATEANLIGPLVASREALRVMRRQGRGHIVTLTDPAYMLGAPLHAAHAASVAALSSWTRALQAELDETEIRVTEYFVGAISSVADEARDGFGAAGVPEGRLARFLATAESPEDIAQQLVACVRRPRATGYSSAAVRAAAAVGLFSRLRVRLGAGVARSWRARNGVPVFTPMADSVQRREDDVVAAPAPILPELPAGAEVKRAVERAEPPPVEVAREAPRKAAAKKASRPRGATKRAAVAKPAAGKSSVAPQKKAPRGKKVAPLSPEATARVRAAAERAAASARGKASPAAPPTSEDEES